MTYEYLLVDIEENVAMVTINRPPVNPLNTQVFKELSEVFEKLDENDEVRAVVLTGAGKKRSLPVRILMKWPVWILSASIR